VRISPATIDKRERTRQLKALRKADVGDSGPSDELIARSVTDNLYRFVMPAVAGSRRLVPTATLASKHMSVSRLGQAMRRGRREAQNDSDGQWHSTAAWVNEYLDNRYRRET
jgi:hypothetical protein